MNRRDTRYILTKDGKTFVGVWLRNKVELVEDSRTADQVLEAAVDKGWRWKYESISFGTKTMESICGQIGYDWDMHSMVWNYE